MSKRKAVAEVLSAMSNELSLHILLQQRKTNKYSISIVVSNEVQENVDSS